MKTGIISISGTFCGACSYAIEKAGRKLKEVEDITVNVGLKTINVTYSGDGSALGKVIDIVDRLGHSSQIKGLGAGEKDA